MCVKPSFSTGYNLNSIQMGIFTELSILYSKYRPEKRMSLVLLHVSGVNELICR